MRRAALALTSGCVGPEGVLAREQFPAVISALLEFVQQVSRARGKPLPQAVQWQNGVGRRRRARAGLGWSRC